MSNAYRCGMVQIDDEYNIVLVSTEELQARNMWQPNICIEIKLGIQLAINTNAVFILVRAVLFVFKMIASVCP